MAFFPTSIATDANLYLAVNELQTTLAVSIGTGDTTIQLLSSTGFPSTGGVTINNAEVVFYTGISGNSLTGCTRGADGTTALAATMGVTVGATVIAFHHNGLMHEIEAIETALGTNLSNVLSSSTPVPVANGGTGDSSLSAYSVLTGGTTSTGPVQSVSGTGTSGQVLTSNGASALPTWQTGGTGTVTSVTGTTNQIDAATGTTTPVLSLDSNLILPGTLKLGGAENANSNKITNLANGTASTDAAAFGQIPTPNVQTVHKASDDSTTSSSFTSTTFTVTITPSSSTAKILLMAAGTGYSTSAVNTACYYTITNTTSSTQLGGTNGLVLINAPTSNEDFVVAFNAVDSPASTSAQTYAIQIKNDGTHNTHFGDGYGYLIAMEIH